MKELTTVRLIETLRAGRFFVRAMFNCNGMTMGSRPPVALETEIVALSAFKEHVNGELLFFGCRYLVSEPAGLQGSGQRLHLETKGKAEDEFVTELRNMLSRWEGSRDLWLSSGQEVLVCARESIEAGNGQYRDILMPNTWFQFLQYLACMKTLILAQRFEFPTTSRQWLSDRFHARLDATLRTFNREFARAMPVPFYDSGEAFVEHEPREFISPAE